MKPMKSFCVSVAAFFLVSLPSLAAERISVNLSLFEMGVNVSDLENLLSEAKSRADLVFL